MNHDSILYPIILLVNYQYYCIRWLLLNQLRSPPRRTAGGFDLGCEAQMAPITDRCQSINHHYRWSDGCLYPLDESPRSFYSITQDPKSKVGLMVRLERLDILLKVLD